MRLEPTLDRTPFHYRVLMCAHTHSYGDNLGMAVNLTCLSLACGRRPEWPEKTNVDTVRGELANSTQTVAPAKNHFFSHHCYNDMTLNQMTSFEDFSMCMCIYVLPVLFAYVVVYFASRDIQTPLQSSNLCFLLNSRDFFN